MVELNVFLFDNDPIKFKKNGKSKWIDTPLYICGNRTKSKRIDKIKGYWCLNQDTLLMQVKEKS